MKHPLVINSVGKAKRKRQPRRQVGATTVGYALEQWYRNNNVIRAK